MTEVVFNLQIFKLKYENTPYFLIVDNIKREFYIKQAENIYNTLQHMSYYL